MSNTRMSNRDVVRLALMNGGGNAITIAVWCRSHGRPNIDAQMVGAILSSFKKGGEAEFVGDKWKATSTMTKPIPTPAPPTEEEKEPVNHMALHQLAGLLEGELDDSTKAEAPKLQPPEETKAETPAPQPLSPAHLATTTPWLVQNIVQRLAALEVAKTLMEERLNEIRVLTEHYRAIVEWEKRMENDYLSNFVLPVRNRG